ncbi:DHA2 family efflux MFS transporter permease subunit [Nocardioides jishulii]|nr:DHA2 family efflux MFS transporter permease subunit [Nocardioides jishulii]
MTSTETLPGQEPEQVEKLDRKLLLIAGVVVLGGIMSILDVTVVSVALETFAREFDATTADVAWTMTAYTLALATVIPLTGWAADRFGTKRLYLIAVALFTLGSVLCAIAPDLTWLIIFRVVQGLGGGMLMPLGMTILTRAAGPERLGRVMAVMGIPMLLGPIFGPILGGWLIDVASWHWIFLINLPIGIIGLVYAAKVLEKDDVQPSETFDFVGMLLLSPGLASFLYGVSSIPGAKEESGTAWTTEVVATMVIGAILTSLFIPWALRKSNIHPLMDLRLLKNKNLSVALITMSFFAIAFFGASLLFPLYFQMVRGEDALHAGLLLAPQGVGAILTMPLAGLLADKIGPGKIVMTALAVITVSVGMFTQIDADTSYVYLLSALFIMGLGLGGAMMPIMTAALATLTDHTVARGSTLLNIQQQVAASIGTAIFATLLTNFMQEKKSIQVAGEVAEAEARGGDAAVGELFARLGLTPESFQSLVDKVPGDQAASFASVFVVATALVGLCLVPAFFLPREKVHAPKDVMIGH